MRSHAVLDDVCEACGYPFDEGDRVLVIGEHVFCDSLCYRDACEERELAGAESDWAERER